MQGGNLVVVSGGSLTANSVSTLTIAAGVDAGSVSLYIAGDTTLSGNILTTSNGGNGGEVRIATGILNAADIFTNSAGTTGNGGMVTLLASGDIGISNVNLSGGSASGNGGSFFIQSGGGNLSVGAITANGVTGTTSNFLVAPGIITAGNISIVNGTCCSSLQIIAGTGGGGSTPAMGGVMTLGSITMSNSAVGGGTLSIVNMAPGITGLVQVLGTISVRPTIGGAFGGSVSIIASGSISVNGDIDARSGGGSTGGAVFLSSRMIMGNAVFVAGAIRLNATAGGLVWIARNPGATAIIVGGILGSGGTFNSTPAGAVADIVSDHTITIGAGTLTGFNPGGFNSIDAVNGTITINGGADSRTGLVSIVSRMGDISLKDVLITSTASTGSYRIYTGGNITIKESVSSSANSLGTFTQVSTGGALDVRNITVTGTGRTIELVGLNVSMSSSVALDASNAGGIGGNISIWSAGNINFGAQSSGISSLFSVAGQTGGNISVSAHLGITDYARTFTASASAGAGGSISLYGGINPIRIYNIYTSSAHFDASFLANSTNGSGGIVRIVGVGIAIAHDTTICCGGTTTATINSTGTTSGGSISLVSHAGTVDISDPISINAIGPSGNLLIYNHGTISLASANNAESITILQSNPAASLLTSGVILAGSAITVNTFGAVTVGANMTVANGNISLTQKSLTINNGISIQSQTINLFADSYINNGAVTAGGSGSPLSLNPMLGAGTNGMTFNGTASYSISGGGSNTLTLAVSNGNTLTLNGNNTFNPGAVGTVNFNAQGATDAIVFGAGTTTIQAQGGEVFVSSPSITFNNGANLTTNMVAGQTLNFNSGGSSIARFSARSCFFLSLKSCRTGIVFFSFVSVVALIALFGLSNQDIELSLQVLEQFAQLFVAVQRLLELTLQVCVLLDKALNFFIQSRGFVTQEAPYVVASIYYHHFKPKAY